MASKNNWILNSVVALGASVGGLLAGNGMVSWLEKSFGKTFAGAVAAGIGALVAIVPGLVSKKAQSGLMFHALVGFGGGMVSAGVLVVGKNTKWQQGDSEYDFPELGADPMQIDLNPREQIELAQRGYVATVGGDAPVFAAVR